MKYTILLLTLAIILLIIPTHISRPSFNGPTPGCAGGGCHTFQDALVSVSVNDLQIAVTLAGISGEVAGELVDGSGTVVDEINVTNSNPFTLTAPGPGNYTINAGHKSPLRWDSASVSITITDVGSISLNPIQFKLYDNYPNPFNPSTTIRYSIPESATVSIKIHNALGKEVAELVNEFKSSGTYEVDFNASNLSSGIYYYTLTSGKYSATNKMILIK